MSEQAEATSPTATEETEPEVSPPRAPEASGAEAQTTAAEDGATSQTETRPAETQPDPTQPEQAQPEAPQQETKAAAEEPAAGEENAELKAQEAKAQEPKAQEAKVEEPKAEEPKVETRANTEAEAQAQTEATEQPEAAQVAAASAEPMTEEAQVEPVKAEAEPKTEEAQTEPVKAEQEAKAEEEEPKAEEAKEAKEAKGTEEAPKPEAPKTEPKPLTEEEKARLAEIEALRLAKENHEPVTGRVIGWNQGGFHVVMGTITTFCPRSELELKNPKSPNYYLDKEFQFYVIKHQKKGKRIVVSRKQLLEEERTKILESMKETLVPGKDLEGRVSSITDFGAFVDVGGGIEGLVHVTELSNRRIKHPRDFVELGQEVKVRVLKVEEAGERISLSMKALEPNPYEDFANDHPRGSKFQGKVVRKTDFGIFVELLPGLDGMVHISQLPPGKSQDDGDLEVGKEVAGWVLRVEPNRERISLSLKEVPSEDPWKGVRERYPEGTVVEGQVEDVAPFGVFIQLEPGLTGLLPNSEMNLPRGQDRTKHYPPGKKVEILVASVDPQRKRISLAPVGAQIEGSRSDYRDYMKQQKREGEGMTAMAAAFAKLKDQGQDQAGE